MIEAYFQEFLKFHLPAHLKRFILKLAVCLSGIFWKEDDFSIIGLYFINLKKQFASKNDWILQIVEDKEDLNIDLTEEEIIKMKKPKFKKLIKEKLYEKANEYLFKLREKHSKTEKLSNFKVQEYRHAS